MTGFQTLLARSDAQAARQSVFPAQNFITSNPPATGNPRGNTNHRTIVKQKRKRRVSDPTDAIEIKAKHLRKLKQGRTPTAIERPYYPTAPTAITRPPVPTNEAVATLNARTSTVRRAPTAIEHPYYPTAPTAATRPLVPTNEAVATLNTRTNTVRWIPKGCID